MHRRGFFGALAGLAGLLGFGAGAAKALSPGREEGRKLLADHEYAVSQLRPARDYVIAYEFPGIAGSSTVPVTYCHAARITAPKRKPS